MCIIRSKIIGSKITFIFKIVTTLKALDAFCLFDFLIKWDQCPPLGQCVSAGPPVDEPLQWRRGGSGAPPPSCNAPSWTSSSVGCFVWQGDIMCLLHKKGHCYQANSDTWYSYVHTKARENLQQRDCWQLLEVLAMQELHSVPWATHVSVFVLMLAPFLNEKSEHLHWENVII